MNQELIDKFIKLYGNLPYKSGDVSQELLSEYEDILGPSAHLAAKTFQGKGYRKAMGEYFQSCLSNIFEANQQIEHLRNSIHLVQVETDWSKETAFNLKYDEKNRIIMFDTMIPTFLNLMNKVVVYGFLGECRELNRTEMVALFFENLMYFTILLTNDHGFNDVYKIVLRPRIPRGKSSENFHINGLYNMIQEIFMLSHEIAHLLLMEANFDNSGLLSTQFEADSQRFAPMLAQHQIEVHDLHQEVVADDIAFGLTLNTIYEQYRQNKINLLLGEDGINKTVSSAIFCFARYYYWLRSVTLLQNNCHTYIVSAEFLF